MNNSIKNRNEAYKMIGNLSEKRTLIWKVILENPNITIQMIAYKLGVPINEVSGRVTELKERFLIKEIGSRYEQSKTKHTCYDIIVDNSERIHLINLRYIELRTQKEDILSDYFFNKKEVTRQILKKELNRISKKITALDKVCKSL